MQQYQDERLRIQMEINAARNEGDIVKRDLSDLHTNLAALQADKDALAASLDELAGSVKGAIASASETLASVRVIMKSTQGLINDVKSEIPALTDQVEAALASLTATREAERVAQEFIKKEYEGLSAARADLDIYRERLKADYANADKALLL